MFCNILFRLLIIYYIYRIDFLTVKLLTLLCNLGASIRQSRSLAFGVPFNTFSIVLFLYILLTVYYHSASIHIVFYLCCHLSNKLI